MKKKCNHLLEKLFPKKTHFKPNQWYYYKWYHRCVKCFKVFMPEKAKVYLTEREILKNRK